MAKKMRKDMEDRKFHANSKNVYFIQSTMDGWTIIDI